MHSYIICEIILVLVWQQSTLDLTLFRVAISLHHKWY